MNQPSPKSQKKSMVTIPLAMVYPQMAASFNDASTGSPTGAEMPSP